ncbi:MAG: hypothetical protein K6T83_23765, partial [Alicyclobacillus sp.]|nr:hypothetical protein [Alicyclobacillus sp.]
MERRRVRPWWWAFGIIVMAAAVGGWWLWRPRPITVQVTTVQRGTLSNQIFATGLIKPVRRQIVMPG